MHEYFLFVLNNTSVVVDEQLYGLFLKTFQCFSKFAKAGDAPFNRQTLNYVRMHFKWIVKWIRKLTVEVATRFATL